MQYLIVPQSCLLINVVLHRQTRHQELSSLWDWRAHTSSALASVSDATERLQRERDLALCRIDELHVHYKKEIQAIAESHVRRDSTPNRDYLKVSGDLEVTKRQLDQVQSLCDTQNLMIKRLQEQLGEEAEFDPDMDPHVRRVHLAYEGRIEEYEEDDDEQSKTIEKLRRERTLARNEAAEAQREKLALFDEQKRLESQVQRLNSEISRRNQAMDK